MVWSLQELLWVVYRDKIDVHRDKRVEVLIIPKDRRRGML
ncbi:hypothetical protein HMPREF0322_03234 [Desulfitobacterium hafniense DP7]|uniref:Uncharacterized protein n=1 Tax=Desulfitobacterium hafniense DP7 TaxID=537010 RepID=G9XQI6_DESHA|nr:hypothetical protein HMPREF0322_03234 [Desulfitobacterium hafniense DP7]